MEITEQPQIDAPNFFAAFQGWNDAGQAATTAVRYLVESWKARQFARIDPEDYFSFTDTRPMIRIVDGDQRELAWPRNDLYFTPGARDVQSAMMLIGTEPNLKWRTFCGEIIDMAKAHHARRIVTVGALITDAVHTRPVPLTGFSNEPAVQERLAAQSVTRSYYEGPTGIVGTLHNLSARAGLPAMSVWAATPYYLGATPNPKTALGLLSAVDHALDLHLNLNELQLVATEFEQQVTLAVRDNDEVRERIAALEQQYDEQGAREPQPQAELPPTGAIIADLEEFLRNRQRGED